MEREALPETDQAGIDLVKEKCSVIRLGSAPMLARWCGPIRRRPWGLYVIDELYADERWVGSNWSRASISTTGDRRCDQGMALRQLGNPCEIQAIAERDLRQPDQEGKVAAEFKD